MAESLKEVIARLKTQHNPAPKVAVQEVPKPVEQNIPVEDEEDEIEFEENPEIEKKAVEVKVNPQNTPNQESMSKEQQAMMEIEMLQNDGRFRAELLFQLQEINKAMVVMAGIMADMSGHGGK